MEWWGWQDDVPTVISMSHIVCLPSYREGLPKILIEAASSGVCTAQKIVSSPAIQPATSGQLIASRAAATAIAIPDTVRITIRFPA